MAFERFDSPGDIGNLITQPTVSIMGDYWLRINAHLAEQLDEKQLLFASFYFDRSSNTVAIEFGLERPVWYAVKVHRQKTRRAAYNVRPCQFFKFFGIQRQLKIPAKIVSENGKQRVVFRVKTEEVDDGI